MRKPCVLIFRHLKRKSWSHHINKWVELLFFRFVQIVKISVKRIKFQTNLVVRLNKSIILKAEDCCFV